MGRNKNMNELSLKVDELLEALVCWARGNGPLEGLDKAIYAIKNKGAGNTGYYNTGKSNTGSNNNGHWNAGDYNIGGCNTGERNHGHSNTGSNNNGHWNAGDYNVGWCNTGKWNRGDYNTGFFNTKEPKIMFFNKETDVDVSSVNFPEWLYFDLTEAFYSAEYQDGTEPNLYKFAAQQSYNKASKEDQDAIEDMPNYDADVLFELFGIDRRSK